MRLFLKNKLYRILTISRVLNSFGTYLFNMVFVVYAANQYGSDWAVGMANMIMVLPSFFSLWVGIKSDYTKQKSKMLLVSSIVQALLFFTLALLMNQATIMVFSIVCLFNIISDVLGDYSGGLRLPIMQKNVAKEDMMEAYSFLQFLTFICSISGQALGLWLLEISRHNYAFVAFLNGVCFLLAGLTLAINRKKLTHEEVKQKIQPFRVQIKETMENVKYVFRTEGNSNLASILSSVLILNALGGSIGAIYSIYFLENALFGFSYGQNILFINVLFMLAMILGSLFSNDYFSKLSIHKMIVLTAFIFALMSLTNILGLPSIVGVLILSFAAYLTGKVTPKIDSLLLANTPPDMLARTNSLLTLLFTLAVPSGTVLFSSLASLNIQVCWFVFFIVSTLLITMAIRSASPDISDNEVLAVEY